MDNMLEAITIENFRGIERLSIDGFGRVNLIIGKNDTGKTALMEAMGVVNAGKERADALGFFQAQRSMAASVKDFDGFWRPIFYGGDATRGFGVLAVQSGGVATSVRVRKSATPPLVSVQDHDRMTTPESAWMLSYHVESGNEVTDYSLTPVTEGVRLSHSPRRQDAEFAWIRGAPNTTPADVKVFSGNKAAGRDAMLVEVLGSINPEIRALELLSPTGEQATIFVRLSGQSAPLPLAMLGEGTRRAFEIANSLVGGDISCILCDEIENGIHHGVLEALWTWLAKVSAERDVQVFATTHSDECVEAAARAFTALNDDGLKVIRLDRHEHETTAAIYRRELVAHALDVGLEIRG